MARTSMIGLVTAAVMLAAGIQPADAASRRQKVAVGVGIAAAAIGLAAVAAANRPARHIHGGTTYCQDPRTGLYYQDCGPPRAVYQRPPVIYQPPVRSYGRGTAFGPPQAWTPAWYTYCSGRYRSFNPRTGMFTTNSGRQMMCR